MRDIEKKAQKAAEKIQKSFDGLAQSEVIVNAAIGAAALSLIERSEPVTVESLVAQLRLQAGHQPQGILRTRLEAAETLLRDAKSRRT